MELALSYQGAHQKLKKTFVESIFSIFFFRLVLVSKNRIMSSASLCTIFPNIKALW